MAARRGQLSAEAVRGSSAVETGGLAADARPGHYNGGVNGGLGTAPSGYFQLDWKQLEGQSIDGTFPLIRLLAANGSGVFETEYSRPRPVRAAIKLTSARIDGDALLRWTAASKLDHPNLLKIFAGGECELQGESYFYVVMELADDDLSLVLSERTLTPQETRDMLGPVSSALAYLHSRGFALGSLTPSNVMAVGERVKLPLDHAIEGGDTAGDCHALGVLVKDVLAPPLPEPFREIAEGCLSPEASRWTAARVAERVRQEGGAPTPPRRSPSLVVIASAVVLSLVLVALWRQGPDEPLPVTPEPAAPATTDALPVAKNQPPKEQPSPAPRLASPASPPASLTVLHRVMPEIPRAARDTIQGKVTINVRIQVDPEGNVTNASLAPPAASKYFTDRVLAAAREWKFAVSGAPGGLKQEWMLQFQLFRAETTASVSAVAEP